MLNKHITWIAVLDQPTNWSMLSKYDLLTNSRAGPTLMANPRQYLDSGIMAGQD